MVPELGSFAIIIALTFALIQSCSSIYREKLPVAHDLTIIAVAGQFLFLAFAMTCLIFCFIVNDLTVIFVREHSHHLLPLIYRIGAAWGGHEGSLLLWCLILSTWTTSFVIFHDRHLSSKNFANILMILGWISTGFLLFLFLTSNPFAREFPSAPIVGDDLTPILQDPGLIFHPPMLYLGYVGFAVPFAYALCALIEGKFDRVWAQSCRPWIILPWSFLGCGIVLGSWWAYRELGWGGWWFWDPVENASLLPWLAATALLHSLIVSEKREAFKGWTLLLAIMTFALSLIGTFLVRSGVLVSVHAFASDPTRGLFLLSYLGILVGGALLLYGYRIKFFYRTPDFKLFSREGLLLINSIVLTTAVITILLGTIYPILLDALNLGKISVGEPYFNTLFVPLFLLLMLLIGFAPHVHWRQQRHISKTTMGQLILSGFLSVSLIYLSGFSFSWLAWLGITLALWIMISTLAYAIKQLLIYKKIPLKSAAMIVAHLGIAVLALGITINKSYSLERQLKISPEESVSLAGYQFTFKNLQETIEDNFKSIAADFVVQRNQKFLGDIVAQQRIYLSHEQNLAKPGILANPWRDLYIALGAPLTDTAWSIRIYYKPFVRIIWLGGFLLLLGGLLSLLNYWNKRGVYESM